MMNSNPSIRRNFCIETGIFSILQGRAALHFFKLTKKAAQVTESACFGNFGNGVICAQKQLFGMIEPHTHQIGVGALIHLLHEHEQAVPF